MDEESFRPVKTNILGIFGHGCAHLFIGLNGKIESKKIYETLEGNTIGHA